MDDAVATAGGLPAIRDVPRIAASPWVQAAPPATRYILRGGPDVMRAAGTALGLAISEAPCRAATAAGSVGAAADNAPTHDTPAVDSAGKHGTPAADSAVAHGTPASAEITAYLTPAALSNFQRVTALWLGPDEQLLIAPERSDIGAILERTLRGLPHSLVEVSHRQTGLVVCGPQAALLLNAGCPLDLDLNAFPVGMCTRTVLAKAEIVLWRTRQDMFHVEVWRSFADYVSSFLAEVARELAPGRFL